MGHLIGWERNLMSACVAWKSVPFVWGRADCLHFCIACEHAIFGASKLDGFPSYKTELGGMRHMRKQGFETIAALLDHTYGRIDVRAAVRGDWVMLEQDGGPAFGVVTGRFVRVMGQYGLASYPALMGDVAWGVTSCGR